MRKLAPWYALAVLLVVLDQLSKYWVSASFDYGAVRAVTGFFNLVLTHNTGAAFSFLAGAGGWQRGFFIGIHTESLPQTTIDQLADILLAPVPALTG